MNKFLRVTKHFILFFLILAYSACYKEEQAVFEADFEVEIINNDFSVPTEVYIQNTSQGGERYLWTFEGGIPESSTEKQPENIWYKNAGRYNIKLECWYRDRCEIKEYILQLDSAIDVGFETKILVNSFAPVVVQIENYTTGADYFEWHFEGGIPEFSDEKHPPAVKYENAGEFIIRLISGNERESKEISRTISVLPRIEAEFEAVFAPEDEDREAPATVFLNSLSNSVLRYKWEALGGKIENDTAKNTFVYFEKAGTYNISLTVDNDKEIKQISKEIILNVNTNLITINDIQLGVNTSKESGQFFSSSMRKVLKESEIDENTGSKIDFVFFALNEQFTYCRFLSPDSADLFTFSPIPSATKTFIINDINKAETNFTERDFDMMVDDLPLRSFAIKTNDTADLYFALNTFPKLILFETFDGRKGVVKITKKTVAGLNSSVEADIKVQKENLTDL
ncbi:MAG: hypothetical protein LBR13_06480 [Dysgonamonadaceae bacterium]|jgi:PKD repeat protein|nr:hypothetical protein [Dysgonamonadaceae bacterium]